VRILWRLSLLLALGLASSLLADSSGRVVGVTDGDTITVRTEDRRTVKVRLNGIDCPEKGQAFGKRAKEFTSRYAFGQTVAIKEHGGDRYGRVIGDVVLGDGRSLNAELVRAGLAWHYTEYSIDQHLARLETEARAGRVGLWSDLKAMPPWVYRRGEKTKHHAAQVPATAGLQNRPVPTTTPSRGQNETLHGNRHSLVFHRPGCRNYNCSNCNLEFATPAEAEASGYHPAGCCFPR
jgi:micrococcal nuclease